MPLLAPFRAAPEGAPAPTSPPPGQGNPVSSRSLWKFPFEARRDRPTTLTRSG
jgi:hypothetical protein